MIFGPSRRRRTRPGPALRTLVWAAFLAAGLGANVHAGSEPRSALPPPGNQALWTPEQKIVGFRNIARLYGGDVIHHGTTVLPLPRAAHELDVQYDTAGAAWNTAKFMEHNRVAGLLILHRGRIVLERYGLGQTEHDQWVSFSVAKSVNSTLLAAAIRDGHIGGLDDLVTRYIPELASSGYAGVTLKQALTMTVGLRWDENYKNPNSDWGRTLSLDVPGDTHPAVDVVKYMAALPRASPPGTVFLYNSGNAQILGVVVQRATHETLAAYLEEKIWRPLGMEADGYWVRDRFGRSLGRSLLNATLRDYARFGWFFMHGAKIGGAPILPGGWVADASRSHIHSDWGDIGYGYQWWINPDGSYRAIGICGQMIFLDPMSDTVIVTNSAWPEADWDPGYDAVAAFNAAVVKTLMKQPSVYADSAHSK
jgi:CubicO group peptidase (beta-lactamase class C family)